MKQENKYNKGFWHWFKNHSDGINNETIWVTGIFIIFAFGCAVKADWSPSMRLTVELSIAILIIMFFCIRALVIFDNRRFDCQMEEYKQHKLSEEWESTLVDIDKTKFEEDKCGHWKNKSNEDDDCYKRKSK